MHIRLFAALAASLAGGPSLANDTMAELKTGGLYYVSTLDVSMDEEDLYISPDEVRVKYLFSSSADRDIHTVIAFPMPDITGGPGANIPLPDFDSDNMLGFTVSQDGKPITPQLQQQAIANGVDVTAELKVNHIPLLPLSQKTNDALGKLPDAIRNDMIDRGLIMDTSFDAGSGLQRDTSALWTLHSAFWWKTTFPAGAKVRVEHAYRPSVGGTVTTTYLEDGQPKGDTYKEYAKRFCLDDAMVKAAQQSQQAMNAGKPYYMENWISYVLKTGANWSGTIKRFKLTVDKGKPENRVSFCGTGVRKTGPTTFEMTAQDLDPVDDIDILLLVQVENNL